MYIIQKPFQCCLICYGSFTLNKMSVISHRMVCEKCCNICIGYQKRTLTNEIFAYIVLMYKMYWFEPKL